MNRFEKLKVSIGNRHLKSKLKNFKRKSQFFNFETAKTAGILFSCTDEKSFEAIREFASLLKQKNIAVTAVGYFPGKKVPDKFLFHTNINFFSDNDLNWYYKPKNASLDKFINQRFDLFFDLTTSYFFPADYVSLLSNSAFKIGMEKNKKNDHDLMINIEKNRTVAYLIDQIQHYLILINKS